MEIKQYLNNHGFQRNVIFYYYLLLLLLLLFGEEGQVKMQLQNWCGPTDKINICI